MSGGAPGSFALAKSTCASGVPGKQSLGAGRVVTLARNKMKLDFKVLVFYVNTFIICL
jgi:hypothetical protein